VLLAGALLAGCGSGDDKAPRESADKAAEPPAGWRTVRNRDDGFTVSAPKSWSARNKRDGTTIRSPGGQVVITVVADRSSQGRELPPDQYARETVDDLPDFQGSVTPTESKVKGSPYENARVEGSGRFRSSKRAQRISMTAFKKPRRVTYAVVVFRNAIVDPSLGESEVRQLLRSLRGQPPSNA
jgi:hypothetical protein